MAGFCTNCGTALNDGLRFCIGCGSPVPGQQPIAAAVPPAGSAAPLPGSPAPAPAPASAPASSGLKIVFIVLGVLFVVFAIAMVGIGIVAHRVKTRVESAARNYGIDSSRSAGRSAHRVAPCSLVTRDEAAHFLGVEIDRIEPEGDRGCHYYGKAPTAAEREREMAELQRSLKQGKSGEGPQGVENLVKALGSGMASAGPYFSVKVDWEDGRTMLGAMKFVTDSAGAAGKFTERVSGIGDEALLGPMASMLVFAKGSTGVQIDLRMLPNGREKGIAIAKTVANRLRM
jgi:hypothetical protein